MTTTDCTAGRHGTRRAYREHGCRCPGIVARMRAGWLRDAARRKAGQTARRGRRALTRDQVLDTYADMRAQGRLHKQIARRLELTRSGLAHHLRAARRDGDQRAHAKPVVAP